MHPSRKSKVVLPIFMLLAVCELRGPCGYSQRAAGGGEVVVIKGATVIDGLGNAPVADATLVIEGDKIKSILSGKNVEYPADATVVDATGKFVIPGLIDSHVHWGNWMGELYLNHGVTSVLVQLNIGAQERTAFERSMTAPRVFHSGGRPEVSPDMTDDQVRQAVKEWLKREPNIAWLPDFRKTNKEIYRRTAREVHRLGFLVFSHAQNAPDAIDAGMDVAEHIWGFAQALMSPAELEQFQRGQFLTWATFMKDWTRLDSMIKDAVKGGVYLNPTLVYEWGGVSVSAGKREQETYRLFSNPDLSYIPQNLAGTLLIHHKQIKNFSSRYEHMAMVSRLAPQDWQQFLEGYRNVQEFVRRFAQAGGKIISGTDTSSVSIPGLGIHHEMELLVEAGLSPMQALQASTSWPAEMLAGKGGVLGDRKVGCIKEGNFADLVVLEANPLDNITNTQKIERVMKGGRFFEFGYHPAYFTFSTPPRSILMSTPAPEISFIAPHAVTEGDSGFEMALEGVGFTTTSVVKVGGISVPTRFEGPRKLNATIPASLIERTGAAYMFPATIPLPDRFGSPGPDQNPGVFGDHTIPITVYNPTPEGGISNSISLVVRAR